MQQAKWSAELAGLIDQSTSRSEQAIKSTTEGMLESKVETHRLY